MAIFTTKIDGVIYSVESAGVFHTPFARVVGVDPLLLSSQVRIKDNINGYLVQEIARQAFQNASMVESVAIPNSITNISAAAFSNCENLKKIEAYTNTNSKNTNSILLGLNAFMNCKKLQEVSFHTMSVGISTCAFYNCESLQCINAVVSYAETNAFHGCKMLEELVFVNNFYCGTNAFKGCVKLKKIVCLGEIGSSVPKTILQKLKKMQIVCTEKFNHLDWCYEGVNINISENL